MAFGLIKILSSFGFLGIFIFVGKHLSTPFIQLELIKGGYEVLNFDDQDEEEKAGWEINFENYKKNHEEQNRYSNLESMRNECKSLLWKSLQKENTSDLDLAKEICTKPKDFSKRALAKNYELIDVNGRDELWKEKVDNYQSILSTDEHINLSKNYKETEKYKVLRSDITVFKLQIWCSYWAKRYWKEDLEAEFNTYVSHCAKKKPKTTIKETN